MLKGRNLVLLLIAVLMVSNFVIPNRAAPIQAQDNESAIQALPCEEPGTLTMWVWDENWAKVIGDSIEAWKETYCPGAEVELQVQPWDQYWNLLKTNAAGGDMPDVFNVSQDRFFFYADNDALLDLQPYWDEYGVDTSIWGAGTVDPYRWGENNDLYAGPVNWDTIAIYYNKDMFDAAGLEYPTADWTWDDFAANAAALTTDDVYGALTYLEYQAGYPNWIAATGTTPVVEAGRERCTLTDEGSLEALNFLYDLFEQGYMPDVPTVGGASADDAFAFWASGKVAMITGGSWKLPDAIAQVPFNWDIVQLPKHPETGRSRSIVHSVGYVASSNSANADLAANLILYLVSDEGQRFFAEAGGVAPASPSPELQQMWIDSFGGENKNIQAFVDALEDSQGVTVFDEVWNAMNSEMVTEIFDLGIPVEEAAAATCEFIDTQLPQ